MVLAIATFRRDVDGRVVFMWRFSSRDVIGFMANHMSNIGALRHCLY